MITKFDMTQEMIDIALLQRTSKHDKQSDAEYYYSSCSTDFLIIKNYLPMPDYLPRILDIGSGLGGVDLLIHNFYVKTKGPEFKPYIYLFDRDRMDKELNYGFVSASKSSVYNKFIITNQFIDINIGASRLCVTDTWPMEKFDLITSYISCGFHYPIDEYLGFIMGSIHDESIIILDIRKNSGQFEILHREFHYVDTVVVGKKYKRIVCRNKR